jgi:hypothetical protein
MEFEHELAYPFHDGLVFNALCVEMKQNQPVGVKVAISMLEHSLAEAFTANPSLTLEALREMRPDLRKQIVPRLGDKGDDLLVGLLEQLRNLGNAGEGEGEGGAMVDFRGDGDSNIV